MTNEPKAVKATRKDLADGARQHYDEISTEAMHHKSLIPQAIDAWEREPNLIFILMVCEWQPRWIGALDKFIMCCPVCKRTKEDGHASYCEIDKELSR